MNKYKIAETDNYSKKISSKKFSLVYKKITGDIYPMLRINPFFGMNIRKLKREYGNIYRFRIGNYKLLYYIEEKKKFREAFSTTKVLKKPQKITIYLIDIESRQDTGK